MLVVARSAAVLEVFWDFPASSLEANVSAVFLDADSDFHVSPKNFVL